MDINLLALTELFKITQLESREEKILTCKQLKNEFANLSQREIAQIKESDKAMTTDIFIATVRKYTRARKLTQRMVNELIDRIEVHQAEKVDGVHVQKFKIYYSCVRTLEIPDEVSLPEPDVLIQTRKGVAVSYPASEKAM